MSRAYDRSEMYAMIMSSSFRLCITDADPMITSEIVYASRLYHSVLYGCGVDMVRLPMIGCGM